MILYSDASFDHKKKKAGIACIVVSDSNQVISISTSQCDANDVVDAELKGILQCLTLANQTPLDQHVTLMSDCQIAVGLINHPVKVPAKYQVLVNKIIAQQGDICVEWGSREGNSQADALAVLASRRSNLTCDSMLFKICI